MKARFLIISIPLIACTASRPPPAKVTPAQREARQELAESARRCRLDERGFSAKVVATPNGADVVFRTVGEPGELYTELVALAQIHNEAHAERAELPGNETSGEDLTAPVSTDLSGAGVDNDGVGTIAGEESTRKTVAAERDDAILVSTARRRRDPDLMILTPSHARVDLLRHGVRVSYVAAIDDREPLRNELRRYADDLEDECAWGDRSDVAPPSR